MLALMHINLFCLGYFLVLPETFNTEYFFFLLGKIKLPRAGVMLSDNANNQRNYAIGDDLIKVAPKIK